MCSYRQFQTTVQSDKIKYLLIGGHILKYNARYGKSNRVTYGRNKYKRKYSDSLSQLIFGLFILSGFKFYQGESKYLYLLVAVIILSVGAVFLYRKSKIKKKKQRYLQSGIDVVDKMVGEEFEKFLEAHFSNEGYFVNLTPKSNDYGADLILKKDGMTIVVQAKRWNEKVGIKAIQEIAGAINYYKADKAWVVTNSYFTSSAENLAFSNSVDLWDRNRLISLMSKNGSKVLAEAIVSKAVEEMNCPKCGGDLLNKKGKYGEFVGCSNYPKCIFVRKNITNSKVE